MSLARRLLAQMDMHHAGAGVEGPLSLARHFLRGDRNVMLLRIGQHAVQRAGDDGLVAHDVHSFQIRRTSSCNVFTCGVSHDGGLSPCLLALTGYLRVATLTRAKPRPPP